MFVTPRLPAETAQGEGSLPNLGASIVTVDELAAKAAENSDAKGSVPHYKRLSEHWDGDEQRFVLRERAPRSPGDSPNEGEFDRFCFNIIYIGSSSSRNSFRTLVEIKSQSLKRICQRVIHNHESISWTSGRLRIDTQVFFRLYSIFKQYERTLRSVTPRPAGTNHLTVLLKVIQADYASEFEELDRLLSRGQITYKLLGCILMPGTVLYTTCNVTGEPLACRLVTAKLVPKTFFEDPEWEIEAAYVEATGTRSEAEPHFGHGALTRNVKEFEGPVPISTLAVYPLKWHPDEPEVRIRLISRGRVWKSLDGVFHKCYAGTAYGGERLSGATARIVNSRIIVDRKLYDELSDRRAPKINQPRPSGVGDEDEPTDVFPLLSELSEDDMLLAPALVYGFSLEDKLWLRFNVAHITDIQWNAGAFEQLVLPQEQKDLIKGIVEAQSAKMVRFDDFIEGKGRGLVINLFGPPGVGKTLSAEATSEHLRRPLYVVGADDLGTTPSDLSSALTRIFKLGVAWGAVVLIDEADVYMEQRSLHDLSRNALVSVFLRQLEYFAGLLFLTTNHVRTFDEAFQSRIHVSLRFRNLDEDGRRKLWRGFLAKLGPPQLTAAEESELVAHRFNGRQIKNAVKTAAALASSRSAPVAYSDIKNVVDIMLQFEEELHPPTETVTTVSEPAVELRLNTRTYLKLAMRSLFASWRKGAQGHTQHTNNDAPPVVG